MPLESPLNQEGVLPPRQQKPNTKWIDAIKKHADRNHWKNVQHNLILMDQLYDASFTPWVRDERHAQTIGLHLSRIASDYSPERIVNALRWLFVDWHLANIVITIASLCFTSPGAEASVIAGLCCDWDANHTAELVALLYFAPDANLDRKRIAFSVLERMERRSALLVLSHLQRILKYTTVDNANNM